MTAVVCVYGDIQYIEKERFAEASQTSTQNETSDAIEISLEEKKVNPELRVDWHFLHDAKLSLQLKQIF